MNNVFKTKISLTHVNVLTILISVFFTSILKAEHPVALPQLEVEGIYNSFKQYVLDPDFVNAPYADTGQLLKMIPGSNVNTNGTMTGIAQYRGMYGDRVNVLMDGIKISSGGPNAMDTPISYIPRAQLEELGVIRGIAPVSSGNETIGGTIRAKSTKSKFKYSDDYEINGAVNLSGYSVNEGYDASTILSIANRNNRFHISGSLEDSDDYEFSDGDVTPSRHRRNNFEIGYGHRQSTNELNLEYVRNDTNETGTPALPMDIIYIDTDIVRMDYKNSWNGINYEAKFYWSQVDHKMSNFQLRMAPLFVAGPMAGNTRQRFSITGSEDFGYGLSFDTKVADGVFKFGVDSHLAEHEADVFDPNNENFLVKNYADIKRDVIGVFGEWSGAFIKKWQFETGVRYTYVGMDAGDVSATGMMGAMLANATTLANNFNSIDRSKHNHNFDAVIKFTHNYTKNVDFEMGIARKTRSPSYQERYLWLPAESTGGLADGNNYIGNVNLDPEVSYQFELGIDWKSQNSYFAPRVFYHHVHDYIQGISATNTTALAFHNTATNFVGSSSRLLQFANVDARLFGVDTDFGYTLNDKWRIDGVISYVKGERRDNGDNLYRIAPANIRLSTTYHKYNWSTTFETSSYLSKDDVSSVNNELKTAGYTLLNVFVHYDTPVKGLTLMAGINNILDKKYTPHLDGINRVRNVDVTTNTRIPGPGMNTYLNISYEW